MNEVNGLRQMATQGQRRIPWKKGKKRWDVSGEWAIVGGGLSITYLRPPDAEGRRVSAAGDQAVCTGPSDPPWPHLPGRLPICGARLTLELSLPGAKLSPGRMGVWLRLPTSALMTLPPLSYYLCCLDYG